MTVSRAFLHRCLLAATLIIAVIETSAAGNATADVADTSPISSTPGSPGSPGAPVHLSHGRFQDFPVYKPAGPQTSFAILLSGDEGWNSAADTMARKLAQHGAMVAGIDWAKLEANLEADADLCMSPDGDLENLSRFVQAYFRSPTYAPPVLVGVSSGATVAYAMLAQAPKDTFAAALTLGFCPGLNMQKPLCKGSGLEFTRDPKGRGVEFLPIRGLGSPWLNLQPGGAHSRCPNRTAAGRFERSTHHRACRAGPCVAFRHLCHHHVR
jgi:hypothetical protein